MEGQALDAFTSESLEFYGKVREEKGISITSMTREVVEGLVIYTAVGLMNGRQDSGVGVENLEGLTGVAKANAFKSAETQAKSRLTISLSGIRHQPAKQDPVAEPVVQAVPEVNSAPAVVVPDVRIVTVPFVNVLLPEAQPVPVVSEQTIIAMHKEAEKLNTQVPDKAPALLVAATIDGQASIFDELPETLVVTPPPAVPAKVEIVDAVLAAVQPVTATGVTMPVPVAKPEDQPTRLQYQTYTVRCTKLVRDYLPKTGDKTAGNALLPYLRKVFGVKELTPESTSISLWESTLEKLEKAGSPAVTLAILKGA